MHRSQAGQGKRHIPDGWLPDTLEETSNTAMPPMRLFHEMKRRIAEKIL